MRPGELLHGRYRLEEVVGRGGMGAVYRASDTRLGRTVAVKVLRDPVGPDSLDSPDGPGSADSTARARMRSEANLAASISHPGVAQVYDLVEERDETGAETAFIVMQFVEGHSLAQLLDDQGPMPPEQVMSVVVQVAAGLQAVHDAGIVHRDLKPANIMLTPAGRTVLVDFGIARSATSDLLTRTGTMVGTADYMSPEQAEGASATPRSDLYALGVVAYQCLTGASPFRRESPIATAVAHVREDLPALPAHVPGDVAALLADLSARDPADRPADAATVARRAAAIGAAASIDVSGTF
ncbi:serine/threonine protein kinase, partial [Nocardioides sp. zg-536]